MNIITYPNGYLRSISKEVSLPLQEEDKKLLNELFQYVKEESDSAVGLSAVQVGVAKRMCAIRFKIGDKTVAYKLVNPKIISHSQKKVCDVEGCLSVQQEHANVPRWESVKVYAYDAITNKYVVINARGFEARVLQHEIDHMDGKLYIDYLQ